MTPYLPVLMPCRSKLDESVIPMQNSQPRKSIVPFVAFGTLLIIAVAGFTRIVASVNPDAEKAQASAYCSQVLPSMKQAASACSGLERNQICYGSRSVEVEYADNTNTTNVSFLEPGDKASLNTFKSITTTRSS